MLDAPLQTKILVNGNRFSGLISSSITFFQAKLGENSFLLINAIKRDLYNLLHYFNKSEVSYFECLCLAHFAEQIDNVYFSFQREKIAKTLTNVRRLSSEDLLSLTREIFEGGDLPIRNESYFQVYKLELKDSDKNSIAEILHDIFSFAIDSMIIADGNVSSLEKKAKEDYFVLMANSLSGNVESIEIIRERHVKNIYTFDLVENLEHVLKTNARDLSANNGDAIKEGLKIILFLRKKQELIQKSRSFFDNCNSIVQLELFAEMINEQIKNYNYIFYYSLLYFDSIKHNRQYEYYSIREFFESSGVFQSHFEHLMQENLDGIRHDLNLIGKDIILGLMHVNAQLLKISDGMNQINSNLRDVVDSIHSLEKTTFQTLQAVGVKLSSDINQLNLSVSENLRSINSGIALSNLFSAVQIYQNHSIRKTLDRT